MANFKISQLTQLTYIDPSASIMIVQNGKNYRITVKQLIDEIENTEIDLSKYYTKEEVDNIIESSINDVNDIIFNVINENSTTVDDAIEDFDNIFTESF